MKKIDAILECYGKGKFEEKFEIGIDGELFTGWYIWIRYKRTTTKMV